MGEMLALAERVSRIGGTLVPFAPLRGPHITANQNTTRILKRLIFDRVLCS